MSGRVVLRSVSRGPGVSQSDRCCQPDRGCRRQSETRGRTPPETLERRGRLRRSVGGDDAGLAAQPKQGAGLCPHDIQVLGLADHAPGEAEFQDLPFAHPLGHFRQGRGKALAIPLGKEVEGAARSGSRPAARRSSVSPVRLRRATTAAGERSVHHIVVDEGGGVRSLSHHGEVDGTIAGATRVLGGEQHQRRAKALASPREHPPRAPLPEIPARTPRAVESQTRPGASGRAAVDRGRRTGRIA